MIIFVTSTDSEFIYILQTQFKICYICIVQVVFNLLLFYLLYWNVMMKLYEQVAQSLISRIEQNYYRGR